MKDLHNKYGKALWHIKLQCYHRVLWICLMAMTISSFGCTSSKPFPEEQSLLPESNNETYWLANFVIEHDGSQNFAQMLAVQSYSSGETFTQMHVSMIWANNSWYIQESRSSKVPTVAAKQSWPMVLTIPEDSIRPEWKWYLSRKTLWLNFSTDIEREPVKQAWRVDFSEQKPFVTKELSRFPEIWAIAPLHVRFRLVHEPISPAWMHLSCFRHAGNDISVPGTSTVWMDLDLESGSHLSLLSRISDSSMTILNNWYLPGDGGEGRKLDDLEATVLWEGDWNSRYSKKKYSLNYWLRSPEEDIECTVSTFRKEQEVLAGRQSFWMGGVEVHAAATIERIGAGNMYIFTH